MKKSNAWALLPIGIFIVLYLSLGIIFEYVMKIPMGFYNVPIVVIFLVALLVACLQSKEFSFDKKLTIMGQGIGDKNVITICIGNSFLYLGHIFSTEKAWAFLNSRLINFGISRTNASRVVL